MSLKCNREVQIAFLSFTLAALILNTYIVSQIVLSKFVESACEVILKQGKLATVKEDNLQEQTQVLKGLQESLNFWKHKYCN